MSAHRIRLMAGLVLMCVARATALQQLQGAIIQAVVGDSIDIPTNSYAVFANVINPQVVVRVESEQTSASVLVRPKVISSARPGVKNESVISMYKVTHAFDDTGRYRVRMEFAALDEQDRKINHLNKWEVKVSYPTLISPLEVDSVYYYGESAYINFATREYQGTSLYSYEVCSATGDTTKGEGPFISLDSLTTEKNAKEEKTFLIQGFYHGRRFRFVNPRTKSVEPSEWRIRIGKPQLVIVTPWDLPQDFKEGDRLFDLHQRLDWGPLQFRCVLLAKRGNSWIHIQPKPPTRVRISSDPPGFLPSNEAARYSLNQSAKPWYIVELNPSKDFLDSIELGGFRSVNLQIQIESQFGENVTRRYSACVY